MPTELIALLIEGEIIEDETGPSRFPVLIAAANAFLAITLAIGLPPFVGCVPTVKAMIMVTSITVVMMLVVTLCWTSPPC